MKKVAMTALAVAMASAISVPAYAATATEADSETPQTINVTYDVKPSYTVVIPDSITIEDTFTFNDISVPSSLETFSITNAFLDPDDKVSIKLSSSLNDPENKGEFKLKHATHEDAMLDYGQFQNIDAPSEASKLGEEIVSAQNGATAEKVIRVMTNVDPTIPGTYSDTLTFSIGIEPNVQA